MEIEVNNIILSYSKAGQGRPFILLHGNGEDRHIYDVLSIKLQQLFTVYTIDSRNHGKSSKTTDYSYNTMAEDIYQFVQQLNLNEAYILGFSDGAIVALTLELKYPNTFSKMALLGLNLKPTDFTDENYVFLQNEYKKSQDELIKLMLEQPNIELEQLRDIKIPCLIIAAEHDLYKPGLYTSIMKELAAAAYIEMKNHDHASYVIDQDILYPIIQAHFSN